MSREARSGLLRHAAALSRRDWAYLAVAAYELCRARIELAVRPVAAILADLQRAQEAPAQACACPVDVARLSWAINAAAARAPWRADCLVRAMAASRWLRRVRLQPRFHLGVAKGAEGELAAHAWLTCRDSAHREIAVTGGDGADFAPLISPR